MPLELYSYRLLIQNTSVWTPMKRVYFSPHYRSCFHSKEANFNEPTLKGFIELN